MINRRTFAKHLMAAPLWLSSFYSAASAAEKMDPVLENEVTDLLKRERLIDTAACDRYYQHPGEKPHTYNPDAVLPLVGGGILGIGHLAEEIPIRTADRTNLAEKPGQICYVSVLTPAGDVQQILREFETLRRVAAAHADKMVTVSTSEEMARVAKSGRLAMVPGLDSGNETGGDPLVLAELYRLGLRKMAMTHEAATPFCGSNSSEPKTTPGLSPLGRDMVAECNRLGIMVDVSHCSDITFWGVLDCTKRPIIATHSGARGMPGEARRNLSDEMLRALAKNGGMVGIGGATEIELYKKLQAAGFYDNLTKISLWMQQKYPDREELATALRNPAKQEEAHRALGLPKALPGSELVDTLLNPESTVVHLDYVAKKIGFDHVGIGTDVETYTPQYPWMIRGIAAGLIKRDYSQEKMRKILSSNILRVFRDNEGA
jgi:membrane dipeptidase